VVDVTDSTFPSATTVFLIGHTSHIPLLDKIYGTCKKFLAFLVIIYSYNYRFARRNKELSYVRQASVDKEIHSVTWSFGRFCSWLCGLKPIGFSAVEEPISASLPRGVTIQEASAEQLAEALKSAIVRSTHQTDAIVSFVFSQLSRGEAAKAEVVLRAVIPVIPAEGISEFVRSAAKARPSLAVTVARTAVAMVPDQSKRIAAALESVVAGASTTSVRETANTGH
jgi:hypothetical protein